MDKSIGILSSDTLNRDGYVIAFEALEQSIAKHAIIGMPSLIDHDFHRPLGWTFPFGILIEPKISKTIGNFLICQNEEDINLVYPKIRDYWQHINYESCKDYIDEFKYLLKDNFSINGKFIDKGCVSYNLPNIAEKVFPKLFENLDKSGLVNLNEILIEFDYVGSGIFKNKNNDFSIFCHQYFKRNLSLINNFNTYFIDEFIQLNSNENIKLKIAIDPNLIGLSKTYNGVLEFDYWWGPKFSNDISSLPNQVTRYECNEEQKLFNNILGTEFWWKTDVNEKTLEIEEISGKPSLGINENSYGCRYIHSIYDNYKKEFKHFDGAVRVYSEEQILNRWEVNINKAGKKSEYTKLFRIDGKLELADWKKLCILYYKGNPLLFEYFGAKDEYESLINTAPQNVLANYIPNKINSEDGIRLFVSYHKKNQEYRQFERKIINPDIIEFKNGEVLDILEYDILEIEKYLKRIGEKLDFPDKINFVKPFDFLTNYPIILHGSKNTNTLLESTLKAFKTIFEIQNKKLNKTISFTIGWEMKDFETRLSIFGKSSEIVKWLNLNKNIPIEYENFKDWLIEQRKWIYNSYNYSEKDLNHLLKNDGVLYIKRMPIKNEIITIPNKEDDKCFKISTKGNNELNKLIEERTIFPSHLGLIKKATCTKTGEDYFASLTSKYLDDDVKMVIEEIELLGFFWTDEEYY